MSTGHSHCAFYNFKTPNHRRSFLATSRSALVVLAVCSGLAQAVFAGAAVSATQKLTFTIRDDAGVVIEHQDASPLLQFNSTTGDLSTVPVGTVPLAISGITGNWGWSKVDLATGEDMGNKLLTWQSQATTVDGNGTTVAQSAIQLQATGNVDPIMTYSFSAKNNTLTNQTYTFSYGESIVPTISGNYFVNADLAGSVTRGNLTQIAQILPNLADLDGDGFSEIQTLKLSTDGGLTFINAGVDVGTAQSSAFKTTPFGTDYSEAYGNLSGINYWQFDVSFVLTPNKDAAALSGSAEIIPIPEPATYACLMGGVMFIGAVLRRRRTSSV